MAVDRLFLTAVKKLSPRASSKGIDIIVHKLVRKARPQVTGKICQAILLIEETDAVSLERLRNLTSGVVAMRLGEELGRWCGGFCMIDAAFAQKAAVEEIAGVILHEVAHAKIEQSGFGYGERGRRRIEIACTRAVDRFAQRLQDGPGKESLLLQCREIYQQPISHWSDEELFRQRLSSGGGHSVSRALWGIFDKGHRNKAGRRRGLDAGHLPEVCVKLDTTGGFVVEDEPQGLVSYSALAMNKAGPELRVAWVGWLSRDIGGGWSEVVTRESTQDNPMLGMELQRGVWAEVDRSLVPLEGVLNGAMAYCVAVDREGKSYYGEAVAETSDVPATWKPVSEWDPKEREAGRRVNRGLGITLLSCGEEVTESIPEARHLLRHLRRDYGADIAYAYSIELRNESDEEVRVFWLQSYQKKEGRWRGQNFLRRPLGGRDFLRWFGGDAVDEHGWIEKNGVMRCNFSWDLRGGIKKWAYLAVGRSGELYSGEAEVHLDNPITLAPVAGMHRA